MNTQNTICLLLGFFMASALWGQEQSGVTLSGGQRQQPQLTFAWGDLHIPLQWWATPYYFKAEVELKLEEVWSLMAYPIRFYQNDRLYYLPDLQLKGTLQGQDWPLTLTDTIGGMPPFSPPPQANASAIYRAEYSASEEASSMGGQQKGYQLEYASQLAIVNELRLGDKLVFTTPPGKSAGIALTGLTIKIYNPWQEFQPRFYLPPLSYVQDDISTWQLVKLSRHPRMILRYHSEDEVALKVRDKYLDNPKYELVPIPLLRTDSRYLSDAEYVVPSKEVERVDTLVGSGAVLDPFRQEDLIVEPQLGWALSWGKVEISFSGTYVRQEEFADAVQSPLRLMRTGKPLPVLQVLLTVAPPEGPVRQYLLDGQKPETWLPLAKGFEDNVSLYLEDLVVRENDGKPRRVAVPFALYVFGPRD
jgi:hypothetical protein